MKKLVLAGTTSLIVNAAALAMNLYAFKHTQYLRWAYRFFGGETLSEHAFALRALHTYSMVLGAGDTHVLRFSLLNAVLFLGVWAGVLYAGLVLAERIVDARRRRGK